MTIRWKVKWTREDGTKAFKVFVGAKPTDAITFAKELKRKGIKPDVICANRAWPITPKQEEKRRPGKVWCPYCVRWRSFKLIALKRPTFTSEAFMRCPVCLISTNDYYVKKFNGFLDHIDEASLIKTLTRYEQANG